MWPPASWRPIDGPTYCYLLGLYLGDGHIVSRGRSYQICLSLDPAYPAIEAEAGGALACLFPDAKVRRFHSEKTGKLELRLCERRLKEAFPQAGPGRKHHRTIELLPWQKRLTRASPQQLLRGLIHSDGCRSVNRFTTELPSGRIGHYEYPRYFFSNLSADIRRIFCEHCDLLGIRWTHSNPRNVSIAKRESVARLDEFVGPKS